MDVTHRLRNIVVAALLSLCCLGCQTTDPSVELLESELRWMEDQVYTMDKQLDQKCQQLESCQRNNDVLRREIASLQRGGSSAAAPSSVPDRRRPPSAGSPPPSNQPKPAASGKNGPAGDAKSNDSGASQIPSPNDIDVENLTIPEVDLGPGGELEGIPDGTSGPASEDLNPFRDDEAAIRTDITRIVLNSRLTGGYDFDGQPGDEGLLVVIEPQNQAGEYVALPGDLEIVVVDPAHSGPAARLAKWEFDASETVPHLKQTLLGRGIHLQLPWPNRPPDAAKLRVTVNYRNPAGRLLTAKRDFQVDLIADRAPQLPILPTELSADAKLLPTGTTRLGQLLPERILQPPAAPLGAPTTTPRTRMAASANGAHILQSPHRAARQTIVPQWQPFR